MIDEIRLRNFKSHQDSALPLGPLTLLVGTNASGKSNALEGIRLLSWLAEGRRLEDILDDVRYDDLYIRGALEDLVYDGTLRERFRLGCTVSGAGEWQNFDIEIDLGSDEDRGVRVVAESITSNTTKVPLYIIKTPATMYSREVSVAYNNFARGGVKPTLPCSDRQAVLTQLDIPSRFNEGPARTIIPETVTYYQDLLHGIRFLELSPRRMTEYSSIVESELYSDGRNLSSVLYNLCEVKNQKAAVLSFIRDLPDQNIINISFIQTARREVMLKLEESFASGPKSRYADVLSDGTLRVLAISAALLSAAEGALVVIEEVDNGVHPSRVAKLLMSIQQTATDRNLRVLVTTHNPAMLNALPPDAITDVVVCYRDGESGASKLTRLSDLTDYVELLARGPLGKSLTDGTLEHKAKHQRDPAVKREAGLSWLRNYMKEQTA